MHPYKFVKTLDFIVFTRKMKDIFSVDFRDSIRKVVRQELKEKYSIKTSKDKSSKIRDFDAIKCSGIFGNALAHVPSRNIKDDVHFSIPLFLIESFQYLSKHLKVEGIFRKSGSVGRQKILREILEKEGTCCSCDFVQVHDVAALIKSFFRELPDPLLTCRLTPSFVKCVSLNSTSESISAASLCCLLLPDVHLRVLKYFTQFITEVANHSLESKMTLTNLAIIFAPNLTASADKNSEKSMKDSTQLVELLFKNSHLIGMVPDALFNKAITLSNEGFCSSSAEELDENNLDKRGRNLYKSTKKRERSKSIKGFIRRNFKQNENSPAKHLRSNSQKVSPNVAIKTGYLKKRNSADDISVNSKSNLQNLTKHDGKSVKRRSSYKGGMSPVRKSPRLSKKAYEAIEISTPTFKSMSNQVAATPRRHMLPIQTEQTTKSERVRDIGVVLPCKFDLSQVKSKENRRPVPATNNSSLARSKSSISGVLSHQHHEVRDVARLLPQPKLSRSTQKPHVRVSRRTSSLEKRREKYARPRRQLPKTPDLTSSKSSIARVGFNIALVASDTVMDLSGTSSISGGGSSAPISAKFSPMNKSDTDLSKKTNDRWSLTPVIRTIRRSISTDNKKPSTPYSITPHIRIRRPVVDFI